MRALLAAAALALVAGGAAAQESPAAPAAPAEAPATPATTPDAATDAAAAVPEGTPDYAAWAPVAARAESLAEAGRGSDFALVRLRAELVGWRATFAAAQSANAARLATVAAQLAALGDPPAEGAPPEDARVAERRAALLSERTRLGAPGALAAEAYAHADGLIGEIDRLSRSRQAARLLDRTASPLDPRVWPEAASALSSRLTGLSKEVTTSVRSPARHETFARSWPGALALALVGLAVLLRGRAWTRRLLARPASDRLRGRHGAEARRILGSVALHALPVLGLWLLAWGALATGLVGARATALAEAVPLAAAWVAAGGWLAGRFLDPAHPAGAPFDLPPAALARAAGRLRSAAWALAARAGVVAYLATGEIDPAARAALLAPFDLWLAGALGTLGLVLARSRPDAGPEGEDVRLRRRALRLVGLALVAVSAVAALLALGGFHRAGPALLVPTVRTLGLVGILIALQGLIAELYGALLKREDGLRDALLPVIVGFVLALLSLPVLALVWGARPEDLAELGTRAREGISLGETRLSPGVVAIFALTFGVGFALTRGAQAALRSTVLPKTRLDPGARTALLAGLGYLGITLSALFAVTTAGLDLSNLAIVAGALSVGIGFGLQTVVSNFVSGIILLVERPISEGDWIEVGGRMGYVRDISVRSTRIETFDRTDVIVPNADLVSGQVVNWTRGNLVGRIILPVPVAMGADPEAVTRILREVAEAHPMVLLSPPPAVVLVGFGADALNFEIRAIVRDVNFGTAARSEMYREIAVRLAAAGLRTAGSPVPPVVPPGSPPAPRP